MSAIAIDSNFNGECDRGYPVVSRCIAYLFSENGFPFLGRVLDCCLTTIAVKFPTHRDALLHGRNSGFGLILNRFRIDVQGPYFGSRGPGAYPCRATQSENQKSLKNPQAQNPRSSAIV